MATKKKVLKQLKQIAKDMPQILVKKPIGERISGTELAKSGEKVEGGKDADPDKMYRKKTISTAPLNHVRQMKQQYKTSKTKGVVAYVQAVRHFEAKNKKP